MNTDHLRGQHAISRTDILRRHATGAQMQPTPADCPHCHGTGVNEVPSMVGFGTEPYVCACAAGQALHPEYKAAIDATRKAWIDRAIR